jgi:uncharacterized protein (TIGR02001 family)
MSDAAAQRITERWNASVTLASDYFQYGLSQTGGGPAWRLAADYRHPDGFFAGGHVANVDYHNEYAWSRPREQQLALYGGYQSRGPNWSSSASVARYRYPGLAISYDYSLISAGAAYRDRYFVRLTYSPDWLGIGGAGTGYEVGVARPVAGNLELGVALGRMAIDSYADGGFTYWNAGVSRAIGRFAVDLRYHASTADQATWLGDPGQNRLALSVSYAIAPRGQ